MKVTPTIEINIEIINLIHFSWADLNYFCASIFTTGIESFEVTSKKD